MEFSAQFDVIGPILQIGLIDLLLSGDNAVLIALAARSLPPELRTRAVFLGTGAAILFRVILTFAATLALRAPYLKLVGAILLLLIALELLASNGPEGREPSRGDGSAGLWKAVLMIVAADAVMSLDNVVAVAAAAQDNFLFLLLGLLLSIPVLVFSSLFVARLLDTQPWVVLAGAALLGWIAGRTAVSDPAIARAMDTQSFGLVAMAPVLGALYVVIQGQLMRSGAGGRTVPRPAAAVPAAPPAPPQAPRAPEPPPAAATPPVLPVAAHPVATTVPAPEPQSAPAVPGKLAKYTPMDLAILAGVAVPLLGLLAMILFFLFRAVAAH